MATYVGVDGCVAGWFAVSIDDNGDLSYRVFADVSALWNAKNEAEIILIDMPIGLAEVGQRACDIEARRVLANRRSSVFPVPTRAALYASNYKEASHVNRQISGLKISKQTWNIMPKIRELDELLRGDELARFKIAEIHPEVLFWGLTGQPMMESKKTDAGYEERVKVLQALNPNVERMINDAMREYPRKEVARDDIVDAMVAAITAKIGDFASLPARPPHDGHGLPMQVLYAYGPDISRRPQIIGFHHMRLNIPRGEELNARLFYLNIMGLEETEPIPGLRNLGGFWLSVGDLKLHIDARDLGDEHASGSHIVFEVDNLPHWIDLLQQHSVQMYDTTRSEYRRIEFEDPFNNRIELIQPL